MNSISPLLYAYSLIYLFTIRSCISNLSLHVFFTFTPTVFTLLSSDYSNKINAFSNFNNISSQELFNNAYLSAGSLNILSHSATINYTTLSCNNHIYTIPLDIEVEFLYKIVYILTHLPLLFNISP